MQQDFSGGCFVCEVRRTEDRRQKTEDRRAESGERNTIFTEAETLEP